MPSVARPSRNFPSKPAGASTGRTCSAALLAPIVVCGALDLSNERGRSLAENGLRKTLAAVEDLEAGEFLPTPRPLYTPANAFSISPLRCAYKLYKTVR